ncbi:MAG: hypothetical protein PHD97_13390 [Bacteroidales bacterium]|nr:hypothetical protein [Bacteroidales bacterium]
MFIKKNTCIVSVTLISLFIFSCSYFKKEKSDEVVARVYGKYLDKTDLLSIVPKELNPKDSEIVVRNYINSWIKLNLLLHKAEENLTKDQKNFDIQLEDYRNSLITYAYEKELIRQKLDTVVTEEQIKNYYNKNEKDFLLRDNIVKVLYVKTPLKTPALWKVKMWCKSVNPKDRALLEEYCREYAENYFLDDESWLLFDDVLKEIPIKTYDQENYLMNHTFIEIQDAESNYFVNIKGFKIKESVSPLSFERDNVRNIIINKRKIDLVNEMEKQVLKDAAKNKDFEIYEKKQKK